MQSVRDKGLEQEILTLLRRLLLSSMELKTWLLGMRRFIVASWFIVAVAAPVVGVTAAVRLCKSSATVKSVPISSCGFWSAIWPNDWRRSPPPYVALSAAVCCSKRLFWSFAMTVSAAYLPSSIMIYLLYKLILLSSGEYIIIIQTKIIII